MDQAVGAQAVADRGLEFVGVRGQHGLDEVAQLHLAERAARLLVGEDVLQADHLRRQRGDVALRLVDDGQPLAQRRQRLPRLVRGVVDREAHAHRDAVELLLQRALLVDHALAHQRLRGGGALAELR